MKKKTGKKFEKLTESIFKKLIKNTEFERVEHNVMLEGADGKRQIDVLVTSESIGIEFITVIECKDYNKKISISTLDGFHSKLVDVKANKGILISRKGFSSKAISKAKRLGITLCTADETENENWESLIDLPVILEEIHLIDLNLESRFTFPREMTVDLESFIEINGHNMVELIQNKWKRNEFDIDYDQKDQKLTFPELEKPYTVKNSAGEKFEIESLEILCNIRRFYFLTSTSKMRNTQILDYIIEGKRLIWIDVNSLSDTDLKIQKISGRELNQLGQDFLKIRILPHIDLKPENMAIRKIA